MLPESLVNSQLYCDPSYRLPKVKVLQENLTSRDRDLRENNSLFSIKDQLKRVLHSNDTSVNLDGSSFLTVHDQNQTERVASGKTSSIVERLRRGEINRADNRPSYPKPRQQDS